MCFWTKRASTHDFTVFQPEPDFNWFKFLEKLELQPLCSMGMGVILALCPATAWRKMNFCGICQATLKVIKNNQQQVLNQLFNSISTPND